MQRLTLIRFDYNSGDGTIGRLGSWSTIEDDWLDNKPNVSCIPTGGYVCKRGFFHKGGYETFEITDVPDRSRILFHIANTEEDVQGCIGLGLTFGTLHKKDEDTGGWRHKISVTSSRIAFNKFMQEMEDVDEFVLNIIDFEDLTQ
jgi:hypothetical protein